METAIVVDQTKGESGQEEASTTAPVVYYGPFHRLQSPTQTNDFAQKQEESGELWGRARRFSNIPQVQAYIGPLPENAIGIEFMTTVKPDEGTVHARWTGPREGVRVNQNEGFAKIGCTITKNTQLQQSTSQEQAA